MKKTFLITFLVIIGQLSLVAQSSQDILGVWQNENLDQRIEIYEDNNRFYAKLVWLNDDVNPHNSSEYDIENNDKLLRDRMLIGLNVLSDFEYLEDKKLWKSGEIYNIKNGNSYNGKIQLKKDELHLTGFYGILFFLGKTQKWTRFE